jgi:hypothetical protein
MIAPGDASRLMTFPRAQLGANGSFDFSYLATSRLDEVNIIHDSVSVNFIPL